MARLTGKKKVFEFFVRVLAFGVIVFAVCIVAGVVG